MNTKLKSLIGFACFSFATSALPSDEVTPYISCHDKAGEYVLLSEDVGTKGLSLYVTNSIESGRSISSELAYLLRQGWSALKFHIHTPTSSLCKFKKVDESDLTISCIVPAETILDLELEPKISRRIPVTGGAMSLRISPNGLEKPLLEIHLVTQDGKGVSIRRELDMKSRDCSYSL